jgi:hypothetical protein
LSRTGIDVYNYVLRDSAYIDNKKCYNILFYPRRKNELTFKGDFWVNDTTFAINFSPRNAIVIIAFIIIFVSGEVDDNGDADHGGFDSDDGNAG